MSKKPFVPDLRAKSSAPFVPVGPSPLGISREEAERLARACSEQIGYAPDAAWGELIASLGGKLREDVSLGSAHPEMEALGERFSVWALAHTHPRRDRFDIARSVGHWALHYMTANQKDGAGIVWMQVGREDHGQATREALWFAFELTMPEAAVRKIAKESPPALLEMRVANAFAVTERLASLRLKGLDLDPEATQQAAAAIEAAKASAKAAGKNGGAAKP
jgi:hypothetical protein